MARFVPESGYGKYLMVPFLVRLMAYQAATNHSWTKLALYATETYHKATIRYKNIKCCIMQL